MSKKVGKITNYWNQAKESLKAGDMTTFQQSIELALVLVGQATMNGSGDKDLIEGVKNDKSDIIFLTADLMNSELLESFQKCSILKVRINQTYCDTETYSFNMSKSTSALNFINY